ncbi:hypothetical protein [Streptomyces sp. NBC_00328]|uniref:hypothetical protein n=1 Tax=Streptomyces sp. NBC_00328 TaxID=2903646 RepID=UPI002E2CFC12|nr:hypothetical protein [Streptomyces sp. NBC_00328]
MRGLRELLTVVGALGATAAAVVSAAPSAVADPAASGPVVSSAVRESAAQRSSGDSPDVALTIAGDTGRTTTLHNEDPDFARLWRLLSPRYTGTEKAPDGWKDGHLPEPQATVIWGVTGPGDGTQTAHRTPDGDVTIERQDQVYLALDGTPWVQSNLSPDSMNHDIRWHPAPRSVFDELMKDGRLFGSGSAGSTASVELDPAFWAVPGLAAGVALGAGAAWFISHAAVRARRENAGPLLGPHQELIELP